MKLLDIPRSGSYAGVTSSHNRAGQYLRNRRTPVNNPTPRRTLIRSALGSASAAYGALTGGQQLAWAAAADAHPITDRLGQSIKLTGHQFFVSNYVSCLNAGLALPVSPPTDYTVYAPAPASAVFTTAGGLVVTWTPSPNTGDVANLAASKPLPSGRTFNATFSQYGSTDATSGTFTISTAGYSAIFGTPAVGQRVFFRLTPVSVQGISGVPVVGFAIVS